MVSEVLNSYRLTLDYLRRLLDDVPAADFTRQPPGVVNHPAWVIGHLTYSCQAIGGEIGLVPWLSEEWKTRFGTGSIPVAERAAYPTKEELLNALSDAEQRLSDQLFLLGDPGMSVALPDERYRDVFPTLGHAVLHILTSHTAVHVGQVSVWRRASGFPALSDAFV